MISNPKFVHVNIVAQDWERLAAFYRGAFGCTIVPPERHLSGQWLEDVTGVAGAIIDGAHLRLPGYGNEGPTLEIFQYDRQTPRQKMAANNPGLAHIAFAVDDVEAARQAVLTAGGRDVGKLVVHEVPGVGTLTVVYVTDPEYNIIELQKWSRR